MTIESTAGRYPLTNTRTRYIIHTIFYYRMQLTHGDVDYLMNKSIIIIQVIILIITDN